MKNSGSSGSANSIGASVPLSSRWWTLARRARCPAESLNDVSFMPSGPSTFCCKYASSFWPDTFSTILPTQSMLMPYSQPSPGSNSSGVVSAAFVHVVMPGVFVTV
jgi:hypothetical protein